MDNNLFSLFDDIPEQEEQAGNAKKSKAPRKKTTSPNSPGNSNLFLFDTEPAQDTTLPEATEAEQESPDMFSGREDDAAPAPGDTGKAEAPDLTADAPAVIPDHFPAPKPAAPERDLFGTTGEAEARDIQPDNDSNEHTGGPGDTLTEDTGIDPGTDSSTVMDTPEDTIPGHTADTLLTDKPESIPEPDIDTGITGREQHGDATASADKNDMPAAAGDPAAAQEHTADPGKSQAAPAARAASLNDISISPAGPGERGNTRDASEDTDMNAYYIGEIVSTDYSMFLSLEEQAADPGPEPAVAQGPEASASPAAPGNEVQSLPEWELSKKYYTIGEVARLFDVNTSHIRFWSKEFSLKLRTTRKGDRMYTPNDIEKLRWIHELVKVKKHTIKGAREILQTQKKKVVEKIDLKDNLKELKSLLVGIQKKL